MSINGVVKLIILVTSIPGPQGGDHCNYSMPVSLVSGTSGDDCRIEFYNGKTVSCTVVDIETCEMEVDMGSGRRYFTSPQHH